MTNYVGADYYSPMEKETWPDVGSTVHEQAEGKFTTSVAAKARMGVVDLDLQLGANDIRGQTGTGSYGKEARAELKKLAELEDLHISSIHAPIMQGGINNLSGYAGENGFQEEARQQSLKDMQAVIDFASDVSTDKKPMALTVHIGEFPRDIMEVGKGEFEKAPGAVRRVSVTNSESGKIFSLPIDQKLNIVKMEDKPGQENIPPEQREKEPVMKSWTFDMFKDEVNELNQQFQGDKKKMLQELNRRYAPGDPEKNPIFEPDETDLINKPEIIFLRAHVAAEARSAFAEYKRWEAEANRLRGTLVRAREEYGDNPSEDQKQHLAELEAEMRWRSDTAINAERKWADASRQVTHFVPTKEEGLKRSGDSLGVSAVMAWEDCQEKGLKNPIAIAPENIDVGAFGSHPDEMIELVEAGRKAFVQRLTRPEIEDPSGKIDPETGEVRRIENPFYHEEFAGPGGIKKAKKIANDFIKVTLDTQHLGLWKENFKRKQGETEMQRRKRFDDWFLGQTRKLAEKGIIGNVHVVDGISSMTHLPAGQGILPVAEAVSVIRDTLRAKGMDIPSMVSEGHSEGPARQVTETWRATGKSVYSHAGTYNWSDIQDLRPGATYSPTYLFGELATHREDFTSWSEVPLE